MAAEFDYGVYYREVNEDTEVYATQMAAHVLQSFDKWLPIDIETNALDIGCGMGFAMLALKTKGYSKVMGVDTDRSQIEACKARGLDVELISDLDEYLKQHTNYFHVITMLDVLEHIPQAQQIQILKRICGALVSGGRLILQVPNASSIIAPRWQYQDFTHHCSFTELSIKFALVNAQFRNVIVPFEDNIEPRPSLRPSRLFTKGNRHQFKRWVVRRLWRQVMIVEMGERRAASIPLGVNLVAIADKVS